MRVVRFADYEPGDTIQALEDLLTRAKAGQIRGIGFFFTTGSRRHRLGLTGHYIRDPFDALACATRLEYKINQIISTADDELATATIPL